MSSADLTRLYNNAHVICPLCGTRRARRGCPALDKQICAVCCGTKRLVEIQCPSDCPYLGNAREHPPAAVVRQQQRDMGVLAQFMRDFTERQSQLFFLVATFLARYQPPELQPLIDDDVREAAAALAATFETASRGVIYEHRPASLSAERLVNAMKPLLAEVGKGAGSAFERDAVVVLRRVEDAARDARALEPDNRRVLLDVIGRLIAKAPPDERDTPQPPEPRLIMP
jgi:hypothetical protein